MDQRSRVDQLHDRCKFDNVLIFDAEILRTQDHKDRAQTFAAGADRVQRTLAHKRIVHIHQAFKLGIDFLEYIFYLLLLH